MVKNINMKITDMSTHQEQFSSISINLIRTSNKIVKEELQKSH